MKNAFTRQKNSDVPASTINTTGRLGTASKAALQQQQSALVNVPLTSTARRPTTAQKRPTTAIQGAGFMAGVGAFGSYVVTAGPNQFEKKEERYMKLLL